MMQGFRLVGKGAAAFLVCAYSALGICEQPAPTKNNVTLTIDGIPQMLTDWEQEYLIHAVDRLFTSCKPIRSDEFKATNKAEPNELIVTTADGRQRVVTAVTSEQETNPMLAMYEVVNDKVQLQTDCSTPYSLPVASIIEERILTVAATNSSQSDTLTTAVINSDTQTDDETSSQEDKSVGLTSYKPNRMGWTFDDNDVESGYLDAFISVKYPLFHSGRYRSVSEGYNPNLYFAFTGRFSQYIETIESSPVVGKQFNPKLFSRIWLMDESSYVDIGFSHESNGQSISTAEAYQSEREKYAQSDGDADFARNYISRGWDYLSLDWAQSWTDAPGNLESEVMLKYFFDDGPLQGHPEEYNEWENDGVQRRKEYDGVSILGRYEFKNTMCLAPEKENQQRSWSIDICLRELSWEYTTGYDGMFDNSTNRAEFAVEFWKLPIMIWAQTGYNSDLVDYYRKVDSWGIALELESGQFFRR